MRKIYVSDITLKELSENREATLLFREKTAIASSINDLGVDAVELAPVNNFREDTIIYGTISSLLKDCQVSIPVGFTEENVREAWECISKAEKPCLQVELPVSTVQMEFIHHIKADKMLGKIETLCKEAKKYCENIEFVACDASRADKEFLIDAIKIAEASGATIITICDDAGVYLPSEMAELVAEIKAFSKSKLFVKISDKINMAVAGAYSAIVAGADGVKTAIIGEDNIITGKFSDTIREKGKELGVCTELKDTQIHTSIAELLKKINFSNIAKSNIFENKSGIVLDADSTISQVFDATKALGYQLSDEDNGLVYKAVMVVCEKRSSIGAEELEAIIASNAMQAPSTYHLESYTSTSSNLSNSMTQICLKRDDELICGVSIGDGPIDSAFRAIENSIGVHYEVDDFRIQAVTEGKEALGSAVVKLRNNGKLYSGNGISSDIISASIRAYINALNKIVFEEE